MSASIIGRKVSFAECDGETTNDLESKYEQMVGNGSVTRNAAFENIVVGEDNCESKMEEFLGTKGFTKTN